MLAGYATELNYAEMAIEKVIEIHRNEPPGDILLFMTGQDVIIEKKKNYYLNFWQDIEEACEKLAEVASCMFSELVNALLFWSGL